jgi:hypothetical protein
LATDIIEHARVEPGDKATDGDDGDDPDHNKAQVVRYLAASLVAEAGTKPGG